MPKILVISTPTTEHDNAVTLEEVVEPEHFESPHHAAQLIERVGWAVADAKGAEDLGGSPDGDDPWGPDGDDLGASPDAEDLWSLTDLALTQDAFRV
jgi:hypothetical protein